MQQTIIPETALQLPRSVNWSDIRRETAGRIGQPDFDPRTLQILQGNRIGPVPVQLRHPDILNSRPNQTTFGFQFS